MTTHVISTSGSSVRARPGDRIELHLAENPSTGFQWEVRAAPPGVRLADSDMAIDKPLTPGRAGTRAFTFLVEAAGSGTLELALRQPWDAATPPEQTFTVAVTVSESPN